MTRFRIRYGFGGYLLTVPALLPYDAAIALGEAIRRNGRTVKYEVYEVMR